MSGGSLLGVADRVVVVTGAGSGIGAASTRALVAAGARVLATDRAEDRLRTVEEELSTANLEILAADASTEVGVEEVMRTCRDRFGALHGIVANAGISRHGATHETPPDVWEEVISANLRSVYLAAYFGIPLMREAGGGSFVAVASQIGLVGKQRAAAYCAAKGGVVNLVRAMALDYATDGIRVNCVCPGPIMTPMLEESLAASDASLSLDAIRSEVPAGRLGTPEEIASTILFLLSDATAFVTGAAWVADGGYVAG